MEILDSSKFINEMQWYTNSTAEYMPQPKRDNYNDDESINDLLTEFKDNGMIMLVEGKYFNPYKSITKSLVDFINYHGDAFFTSLREVAQYYKDGGKIAMFPDSCVRNKQEVAIIKKISEDINSIGVKFILIHNDYGNNHIDKDSFEAIKRRSYVYGVGGGFFDNVDAFLGRR